MEVDGLSAWIYSDGAMGDEHNPGLMYRDSYPGSPRKIVLAELEYTQSWNDFDDFDSFALWPNIFGSEGGSTSNVIINDIRVHADDSRGGLSFGQLQLCSHI